MPGSDRIVVVRALRGLGDLLCAVPALRSLRRGCPDAHITLVGIAETRPIVQRFGPYVDGFVAFPGFPGIPEKPTSVEQLPAFLRRMHSHPFDLAIQLHGSGGVSNLFTMLLGARRTAGFFVPGNHCPDERLFFPYPDAGSEVHRWLRLMQNLGFPARGDHLEFPLTASDRGALAAIGLGEIHREPFVCLHAGAQEPARRWPPEYLARVGDALTEQGVQVVLTGTTSERPIAEAVAARMKRRPLIIAGRTTLGAVAALLERATLLITNDTGISHLAVALRTPSVVVFLASDPQRWAPLDRARHRAVVASSLVAGREEGVRISIHEVPSPDEVLEEAERVLSLPAAYAH